MQSFIISHTSCAEQYDDMSSDTQTHSHTHNQTTHGWCPTSRPYQYNKLKVHCTDNENNCVLIRWLITCLVLPAVWIIPFLHGISLPRSQAIRTDVHLNVQKKQTKTIDTSYVTHNENSYEVTTLNLINCCQYIEDYGWWWWRKFILALGLNLLDPVSCRGLFALFALAMPHTGTLAVGFMLWSLPGRHIRPLLLCINQSINQSIVRQRCTPACRWRVVAQNAHRWRRLVHYEKSILAKRNLVINESKTEEYEIIRQGNEKWKECKYTGEFARYGKGHKPQNNSCNRCFQNAE